MFKSLLIDGNSLLNRAFYAMPLLSAADGRHTNAVYGFLNMFFKAVREEQPTHIMVAFDRRELTARHLKYADYKAGRSPMPPELSEQFPLLREVLDRLNVPTADMAGYEADDIIGTVADMCAGEGGSTVILTGDKDLLQLVSPQTTVHITRKGISEVECFDELHLFEVYGLTPGQIPDLKGLMGDSSDNIPGIAGVGEKTAIKLLTQYKTVRGVLDADIPGKLGEKIAAGRDSALMSRELATINTAVPLQLTPEDCRYTPASEDSVRALFSELGFKSLLKNMAPAAEKTERDYQPAARKEITETQELHLINDLKGDAVAIVIDLESEKPSVSLADCEENEINIRLCVSLGDEGIMQNEVYHAVDAFLEGKRVTAYDAKALFKEIGCGQKQVADDAMVAQYLINSLQALPYAELADKYGLPAGSAAALLTLCRRQRQEMDSAGLTELYTNIELPLIGVLADMEQAGFGVDASVLKEMDTRISSRLSELSGMIYSQAGESFNINSTKQLGDILFEKLHLPHGRKTKTGYSTNAEVLEQLEQAHPIVSLITEYRQLQKIKSTYIDGLLAIIGKDGRVRSSFNQTVTATGRISSSEPNLQNIPVRTELGRLIRRAFVPREGCVLVDGDYSQIELRVLAHMSGDKSMTDAFLAGEDIHTATAASVFGVPKDAVTREQRAAAKAVNFGIVYGISDFGLSKSINAPVFVAKQYISDYFSHYPGIKAFMDECVESAKKNNAAVTLLGRRRPMPELLSPNYNTRSFGERVAMNTPVQGTAADIIKIAMISVSRALKEAGMETRLILQVHDELILEAPYSEAERACELLKTCMENAQKLTVPLTAEINSGESWYETK